MKPDPITSNLDRLRRDGADFGRILSAAVEWLHQSSPMFDWTGIYELSGDGMLQLGPFSGTPTEHVRIPVGPGTCGSAVVDRRNLSIADVSRLGDYVPCSAEARSELVVLIRRGEKVYAQIGIDSRRPGAFDAEHEQFVTAVADWLAGLYEAREAACPR